MSEIPKKLNIKWLRMLHYALQFELGEKIILILQNIDKNMQVE